MMLPMQRVGLVGVGIIGRAIADTLLAANVPLVVHDVRAAAVDGMPPDVVGADVAAVAQRSDVVLIAVQNDAQCEAVIAEALGGCAAGTVIVVHSTVLPATVQRLSIAAAERGVEVLDAPVAGSGHEGIRDQSMWVLAGGPEPVVDRMRPFFARYSGRVLHTGEVGSAAALKLAHNLFVYLGYQAVRESVELARAAGVADGLLAEVTEASQMMSPSFRVYHDIYEHRSALSRNGGEDAERDLFATYAAVLDKDVRQAVALAAEHGVELPAAIALQGKGATTYAVD
jgi:3-hydroxyisobutyrate dehydrogenase-like beta-hydroxyacid dehydrogenase